MRLNLTAACDKIKIQTDVCERLTCEHLLALPTSADQRPEPTLNRGIGAWTAGPDSRTTHNESERAFIAGSLLEEALLESSKAEGFQSDICSTFRICHGNVPFSLVLTTAYSPTD